GGGLPERTSLHVVGEIGDLFAVHLKVNGDRRSAQLGMGGGRSIGIGEPAKPGDIPGQFDDPLVIDLVDHGFRLVLIWGRRRLRRSPEPIYRDLAGAREQGLRKPSRLPPPARPCNIGMRRLIDAHGSSSPAAITDAAAPVTPPAPGFGAGRTERPLWMLSSSRCAKRNFPTMSDAPRRQRQGPRVRRPKRPSARCLRSPAMIRSARVSAGRPSAWLTPTKSSTAATANARPRCSTAPSARSENTTTSCWCATSPSVRIASIT